MTIEEEYVRMVADADWTDECEVLARMRKRKMRLTPAQARAFAAELVEAAGHAERAANEAVRPVVAPAFDMVGVLPARIVSQMAYTAADIGAQVIYPDRISPDCQEGKHPAGWRDTAWDNEADIEVPCECPCHAATPAAPVESADGAA